jgi:hypothetical protein
MVRSRDLRPNLNIGIAALAVVIFAAWVGSGLGGASVVRYVDDLATPAAALAATVSCALAARRHESQPRLFWSLLAAASAAWAAGELIWAYYDLVLGDGPVVSWADVGYLAAIPLAAAALLAHPDWQRGAAHKTRSVLDGLAIGAALFFLLWILELGSLWRSTDLTTLARVVALAYPLGDVVIVFLIVLLMRGLTRGVRLDLWCLLFGLLAITLSDVGYAYLAEVARYSTGNVIDIGWFAGYVGIALGALAAKVRPAGPPVSVLPSRSPAAVLAPFTPLLSALTLVAIEINRGRHLDRVASTTAFALVVLVLVRESLLGIGLVARRGILPGGVVR